MKKNILERRHQAYSHALSLLMYEGQMLWTILSTCMVINVLLVGFISQVVANPGYCYHQGNIPCVIGAIAGLVSNFFWFGTFLRNTKYYLLRMSQAKALEDHEFPLLTKEGERFSNGKNVTIKGKPHKMDKLSFFMKNRSAANLLFIGFAVIY